MLKSIRARILAMGAGGLVLLAVIIAGTASAGSFLANPHFATRYIQQTPSALPPNCTGMDCVYVSNVDDQAYFKNSSGVATVLGSSPVESVSAGGYTNANVTVDAFGRVTAITNGLAPAGGGYTTVQNQSSILTQRSAVNLIGDSSCVDNSGSGRTDCTIAPDLVVVTNYSGGSDAAKLQAAINATPPHSTLQINSNLNVTSTVTINKPMTVIVEAGITLTVTGTTIVIGSDSVSIAGRGWTSTIAQGAASSNVFSVTSHAGLEFANIAFSGVAGATLNANNSVLNATSTTDISFSHVKVSNFQWHSIITKNSDRVAIYDSTFVGNIAWLVQGGTVLKFHHNIVRDPQTPNTTFIIPLQFDSIADGGGQNNDITVDVNTFENWPASQCIEFHNANVFTATGNVVKNCYIPISVNTFTAGDVGQHGTIAGNTFIATTSTAYSNSQPGINLSGATGATVQDIVVSGNEVEFGNAAGTVNSDTEGCIVVSGTTDDIHIVGNKLKSCTGNGVSLVGTNTRITVETNKITDVVASTGLSKVCVGVWSTTGQTGYIAHNDCDNSNIGVRLDVSSSMVVGPNNFTNMATARILNPTNGIRASLFDGVDLNGIGTAQTLGVAWYNNTAAVLNAQQYSPMSVQCGNGWDSTNSVSKQVCCGWQVVPVQGAGNPTGQIRFMCSINGGAYAEAGRITSGGSVQVPAGGTFDSSAAGTIGFGTANATTTSLGNSANTTMNFAAATYNYGTGTGTTLNNGKAGAAYNETALLQNALPAKANNTIASATTIAPTGYITHITGTTTIQTITAPTNLAQTNGGGCLILVFDGIAPWNAAGNIFVAGTPTTAGTSVEFCYDAATSKFYPSRTL